MIGQTLDRFRVLSQLGEGGMGAVYEAIDDQSGKRVAIKVLHKEHASNQQIALRFINEARAVNRIDHPGVVLVSDTGQLPDGGAYIVMELLQGETLSKRIRRGAPLPGGEVIDLTAQIAAALAAAHERGIVHRDLFAKFCPRENLLIKTEETLGERGRVGSSATVTDGGADLITLRLGERQQGRDEVV